MIRIFKHITKTEVILAIIGFFLILMQVYLDLTLPDYMSEITQLVQTDGSVIKDILIAGSKMLGCAFGSLILAICVSVLAAKMASNFSSKLRKEVFTKVQEFSKSEINTFSTPSLITRTTNDITQVQMLIVMGLQVLIKAPVTAVWAITKILDKNITWTYAVIIAVLVLLSVVGICVTLAGPKFKKIQKLTDDINRVTREHLTGLNVIRAYNREKYEEKKFEKVNNNLTKTNLFANRTMSFMMPSIQGINSGLLLAIYFIGATLINEAEMQNKLTLFSDMVVFSSYAIQIIMSFMMLVMIFILLPRASVAAKRILEVLDKKISIKDGNIEESNSKLKGTVEFKNVSFKYDDAEDYVLNDITFKVKKGETLAFIGSTGSGKSTIIDLIPRFFDATEGEILVEGVNVKDYKLDTLRKKIGYISQKAVILSGTISSNVSYGINDENNIENAIKIAQAEEFVLNLENKYDGFVAASGKNLSGGQKQRLSIARAICRNSNILIFDDSFSALDYKTDKLLRNELNTKCKAQTKIIVAQRIGTIKNADQIIVIEDGKIVGIGKHDDLLKSCDVYNEIALSQLSKEEL